MSGAAENGALSEREVNRLVFNAWQAKSPEERKKAFGDLVQTGAIKQLGPETANPVLMDAPYELRQPIYDAMTEEQRSCAVTHVMERFLEGQLVYYEPEKDE